jgi:transcriptional antiterminator NusG
MNMGDDDMSELKWYVIHVAAGGENRIAADIAERFAKNGIADLLGEVLVLKKTIQVMRRGLKVQAEERILPGYVLVQMVATLAALTVIRQTPRVLSLPGMDARGDPQAISDQEVEDLRRQVEGDEQIVVCHEGYEIGEMVRVVDGLFASMEGVVEEVDRTRMRLKVSVPILGRPTPLDLDFAHVEKI